MTLTKIQTENLANYVKNNEVVYQVCGELVEVSNKENPENKAALLNDFDHASGVDTVQKGSSFVHEGNDCIILMKELELEKAQEVM